MDACSRLSLFKCVTGCVKGNPSLRVNTAGWVEEIATQVYTSKEETFRIEGKKSRCLYKIFL